MVVTNDIHYAFRMMLLPDILPAAKKMRSEPHGADAYAGGQFYMKSAEEMAQLFLIIRK